MIQKPKGTKDYFSQEANWFRFVTDLLHSMAKIFNFNYIETPIFEHEEVFNRSIGNGSDIVQKEMYVFKDKKNRKLALRPEGTAGVVRSIVENKLYKNNYLKQYYIGPMFRYERPQQGRYRQFNQFGIEMIGPEKVYVDMEVILLAKSILQSLRIENVKLKINYLGTNKTQDEYKKELRKYFEKHKDQLSFDSKNRLANNVLRILDSKEECDRNIIEKAPTINDYYSSEQKAYFSKIINNLKHFDINYEVDPYLVRGIDYYTGVIFEFVSYSGQAGANNTIIGGGRYDNLLPNFGGPNQSGMGFAIGIERLINEAKLTYSYNEVKIKPDVFVGGMSDKAVAAGQTITHLLRLSGIATEIHYEPLRISKIFKFADRYQPSYVIMIGDKELKTGKVTVKDQKNGHEDTIEMAKIIDYFDTRIGGL